VNIGIVGSGNMGASMGKIWAAKGHKVLFSFSTDQEKLRAVAAAAGAAVPEALKAAGDCEGKTLFSCVNCLKPDFSGLEGGYQHVRRRGDCQTRPRCQNGRGHPADGANPGGGLPPPR
jgi:hypothetical protein